VKPVSVGILKDTSLPMLGLHGLHVAFRGLPGVDVVAQVDANPDGIAEKMAVTGAKRHYRSYQEMLDHEALDIMVICSRHPGDHFAPIRAAAERGVHLYCEKPLSVSLEEADDIVSLAEKHQIKIGMAHPARYGPAYRTMKTMIDAGEIGRPLTAVGRGKCDHRGGGEDLIVLGTHILDLQHFLFGTPETVFADVQADGRPIERSSRCETVEPLGPVAGDSIFASFNYPRGVRCTFESRRDLRRAESKHLFMGLTVMGSEGALSIRFNDIMEPVYYLRISRIAAPVEDFSEYIEVPVRRNREIPGAEPLDYSLCGTKDIPRDPLFIEAGRFAAWDLIKAIEEDRQPVSNVFNAHQTIEMIYGIYASHLEGRIIRFPLHKRTHPLLCRVGRRPTVGGAK